MDKRWEREAKEHFTRSWSERRGIESIDRNAWIVLVKVPLDQLSSVLAQRATESRRDVLGSEIEVVGSFAFTYQLVGHDWSIVPDPPMGSGLAQRHELAALSRQLGQPIIELSLSDTSGRIGYNLFERGKLVEHFEGQENDDDEYDAHGLQTQRYVLSPYQDDPEAVQTAYFWSSRRQVTSEEIGNIWDFANKLMLEYDAFDPDISVAYLLGEYPKHGKRYRIENPGFTLVVNPTTEVLSVPELVRVDYFRFGK